MKANGRNKGAKWEVEGESHSSGWKKKYQKDDGNWYLKFTEDQLASVPVITGYPRDTDRRTRSVALANNINTLIEILSKSSKRFATETDVIRAALHIGVHFLYHRMKGDAPDREKGRGKRTYNNLVRAEAFFQKCEEIESNVKAARRIMRERVIGNITDEKASIMLQDILDNAEPDTINELCKRLEMILAGQDGDSEKLVDITNHKAIVGGGTLTDLMEKRRKVVEIEYIQ